MSPKAEFLLGKYCIVANPSFDWESNAMCESQTLVLTGEAVHSESPTLVLAWKFVMQCESTGLVVDGRLVVHGGSNPKLS